MNEKSTVACYMIHDPQTQMFLRSGEHLQKHEAERWTKEVDSAFQCDLGYVSAQSVLATLIFLHGGENEFVKRLKRAEIKRMAVER